MLFLVIRGFNLKVFRETSLSTFTPELNDQIDQFLSNQTLKSGPTIIYISFNISMHLQLQPRLLLLLLLQLLVLQLRSATTITTQYTTAHFNTLHYTTLVLLQLKAPQVLCEPDHLASALEEDTVTTNTIFCHHHNTVIYKNIIAFHHHIM